MFSLALFTGCGILSHSQKYHLRSGLYKNRSFSKKTERVYVDNRGDSILVYRVDQKMQTIDSTRSKMIFTEKNQSAQLFSPIFRRTSLDLDFLTIPFKYRAAQKDFPQQLNANLNGAVFVGFRNDICKLNYKVNALQQQRQITHYGISFGVFTGLGSTAINPSVTDRKITKEYEGVVWSKGIGAIIGINNFTFGFAVGFDDLLDSNKRLWIYQRKPWLGLSFGLNLN